MNTDKPDLINALSRFHQEFGWLGLSEAFSAAKDDAMALESHPAPKEEIDRLARSWTAKRYDVGRIKQQLQRAMAIV